MRYEIPQIEVQALTGLCRDALAMYFLSPNQVFKILPTIDGRTLEVKRSWHGDEEMRGAFIEEDV